VAVKGLVRSYVGRDIRGWALLLERPPQVTRITVCREVGARAKVVSHGSVVWHQVDAGGKTYIYDPTRRWRKKREYKGGA